MEDLTKDGFKTINSCERMLSFHEAQQMVLKLAQFHALGFVLLQDMGLENFQKKYPLIGKAHTYGAFPTDCSTTQQSMTEKFSQVVQLATASAYQYTGKLRLIWYIVQVK